MNPKKENIIAIQFSKNKLITTIQYNVLKLWDVFNFYFLWFGYVPINIINKNTLKLNRKDAVVWNIHIILCCLHVLHTGIWRNFLHKTNKVAKLAMEKINDYCG